MSKVGLLLDKMDKIRRSGDDSWMACCPAHADKTPSLSVRDTGDKILIHCFAGCPAVDVLDAVGLRFGDLYDDPWKAATAEAHANKGRKYKPLKPFDPLEHERMIIVVGRDDIASGKALSFEDRARMRLAIERVKEVA